MTDQNTGFTCLTSHARGFISFGLAEFVTTLATENDSAAGFQGIARESWETGVKKAVTLCYRFLPPPTHPSVQPWKGIQSSTPATLAPGFQLAYPDYYSWQAGCML